MQLLIIEAKDGIGRACTHGNEKVQLVCRILSRWSELSQLSCRILVEFNRFHVELQLSILVVVARLEHHEFDVAWVDGRAMRLRDF